MTKKSVTKILKWFKRIENDHFKYSQTKEVLELSLYSGKLTNDVNKT